MGHDDDMHDTNPLDETNDPDAMHGADATDAAPGEMLPEPPARLPGVPDADSVRAIEAILMVAVEPVPAELLAQLLELPTAVVERLCAELADAYAEAGHGFQLVKVAGGHRFQSHPDQSPYVERFLLDGQRARMSGAALETLAIVAYKQPISRAQVASIRGVDPDGVLRTLQARGYITEVARDNGPGQAILFGTTPAFLEKLGLASLADLPPIAEFVPSSDVVEALEHGLRVEPIGGTSNGTHTNGTHTTGPSTTGPSTTGPSSTGPSPTGPAVTGPTGAAAAPSRPGEPTDDAS